MKTSIKIYRARFTIEE